MWASEHEAERTPTPHSMLSADATFSPDRVAVRHGQPFGRAAVRRQRLEASYRRSRRPLPVSAAVGHTAAAAAAAAASAAAGPPQAGGKC